MNRRYKAWRGWEDWSRPPSPGRRTLGFPLQAWLEVPSTNDLAKEEALRGGPEGWTVVARGQSRGRGRHGRPWVSSPGLGLYLSVLLRPDRPAARGSALALQCAEALAEALAEAGLRDLSVKPPNDVLAGGRKIAGVLAESRVRAGRLVFVVAGIGLNLSQRPEHWAEAGLTDRATSCAMEGLSWTPRAAAHRVLNALESCYQAFLGEQP